MVLSCMWREEGGPPTVWHPRVWRTQDPGGREDSREQWMDDTSALMVQCSFWHGRVGSDKHNNTVLMFLHGLEVEVEPAQPQRGRGAGREQPDISRELRSSTEKGLSPQ